MKPKCMHVHTQGRAHTHAHTSARHIQLGTNHGNLDLAGSLPPSHQSGHLINVTQHPILLHCVFLHSVSRPEAHYHCKLLFSGKLSKALIGEKGEKSLPELPISLPPPPRPGLLFGALFNITTHTNHALKVVYSVSS